MEINQRKHNAQVEINDLIDEAVNNALVRRNEALSALSEEETKNIAGGALITAINPTILGLICPPTTLGIIIKRPDIYTI